MFHVWCVSAWLDHKTRLYHPISVSQYVLQDKISGLSHNALLPMGLFVQVVMWGDSDETHLKCKIWMSSVNLGMFYRPTWPPVRKNPKGSNALWDGADIFSYVLHSVIITNIASGYVNVIIYGKFSQDLCSCYFSQNFWQRIRKACKNIWS